MRAFRLVSLISILGGLAALTGCTAGTTGDDFDLAGQPPPSDGGRCSPGDTQDCICLGGGQGTQVCRSTGASFGSCTGCGGSSLPDGLTTQQDLGSACGNCDGCCDGATCLPFNNETNMKCGQRGQSCSACPGAKVCAPGSGQCVDNAGGCGTCTTGCCNASTSNICFVDQASACGTSCTKCNYGVTCVSGACSTQIDQNAYFKVVVKTAKVLVNTTTCKDSWDYIGEPDPYVRIQYQSGGSLLSGNNKGNYVDGSLNAMWDNTTGLIVNQDGSPFLVPASVFTSGKMQVTLLDADDNFYFGSDDTIADGPFPGTTMLMPTYTTGAYGCATEVTFQLQ